MINCLYMYLLLSLLLFLLDVWYITVEPVSYSTGNSQNFGLFHKHSK